MPTQSVIDIDSVVLTKGSHATPEDGMCVMELSAYLAGEKSSDTPQCVSPVLGAFLRNWNDSVDDAFRQRLKPYASRVIGTANDGKDEIRAWLATDWLVRVCAPAWLDMAKLTQHAMALRTSEQIRDSKSALRVQLSLHAASKDAYAAWAAAWAAARAAAGAAAGDAAWDAAWAAAWAAAGDAAGDAAWAAARDAAWAAAGAAAWAAAGDAAWAAAGDAAWDAARAAAWAAAWAAAGDAWNAARAAAWAAAGDALQPTVHTLQASALELLDRMIVETLCA